MVGGYNIHISYRVSGTNGNTPPAPPGRISIDHQVLQEHKQRCPFGPREAEARTEGSHPSGRDRYQETREYNNQTNINMESSHKRAQRKTRSSRIR